jgi:hypothetical protein
MQREACRKYNVICGAILGCSVLSKRVDIEGNGSSSSTTALDCDPLLHGYCTVAAKVCRMARMTITYCSLRGISKSLKLAHRASTRPKMLCYPMHVYVLSHITSQCVKCLREGNLRSGQCIRRRRRPIFRSLQLILSWPMLRTWHPHLGSFDVPNPYTIAVTYIVVMGRHLCPRTKIAIRVVRSTSRQLECMLASKQALIDQG